MSFPFPIEPMLARLVRELPRGPDLFYEPKWDGFRCLVLRNGDELDLRSRNQRPLARYFPELVAAFRELPQRRFIVDGEVVVQVDRRLDFTALLQRLHPAASRVDRLSQLTPASFIAFDVLAVDNRDLRSAPFTGRRVHLAKLMAAARPPLFLTPCTNDPDIADDWMQLRGGGIDGVMVKASTIAYTPGRRTMLKVKRNRTAECVVAGFRWHHEEPAVGSLLLGLYDGEILRHAGLAASFTRSQRTGMADDVVDHVVPLEGHPWEHGFNVAGAVGRLPGAASRWGYGNEITWVPLHPDLVCEVAYDHIEEYRFRHPPKFVRWRPDRSGRSCTYDQFSEARVGLAEILAHSR